MVEDESLDSKMTAPLFCGRNDTGALILSDKAWLSAKSSTQYEILPGEVRDNTEYAHKASASNRAEMYAARPLSIVYPQNEVCPVLPVNGIRVLGTAPRPGTAQRYGREFVRIAFPTPLLDSVCTKVGMKLKMNSPPIEKGTVKNGYTIINAGLTSSCTLGMIVVADPPAAPGETEVVSLVPEADTFCRGVDFEAACTFMLKAKYKGSAAPLDQIPGYTLVLEPCSITLTDVHDTMLDIGPATGIPKVDLGTSVPADVPLSDKLVQFMKGLNIG